MMIPKQLNQPSSDSSAPPASVVLSEGTVSSSKKKDPRDLNSSIIGKVTPPNDNSNPQQGSADSSMVNSLADENNGNTDEPQHVPTQNNTNNINKPPARKISSGDTVMSAISTTTASTTHRSGNISSNGFTKDTRKLFVGGLPQDITEPEFQTFFGQFGELLDAVVMFDRDTKTSRGFGFVTYVDPEVSQSLLRMGDGGDGIGRLVMRGKTCEVKAATPKGEGGFGGRKFHPQKGNGGRHHLHHHHQQYGYPGHNQHTGNYFQHSQAGYSYADPVGYQVMPDVILGSQPSPFHQGYHPAGAPPYDAISQMYYHGMNGNGLQTLYPGMDATMGSAQTVTGVPPPYFMSPYESTVAGTPPNVVPDYYSQASPAFSHPHSASYVPLVPMPPAANANAPVLPVQHVSTSVMQPVAPGIPGRGSGDSQQED